MEAPTQARFEVELIAGRVTRAGAAVRLSDKELELLILLAAAQGAVPRDRIGETLWPHLGDDRWTNNLKATLYRLRRRLGRHDVVLIEGGTYRLSSAVEIDLHAAAAVVRACGGERLRDEQRVVLAAILDAYSVGGLARFERFEWFATTLTRINELVCGAANVLALDAFSRGACGECIDRARTVLAIDPFDDDANAALIQAHLARGELGAGRRQFRRYAAVLAEEMQAEPSQRLAELVR
jgi:DNA-binding SARP family transcriptional activator